MRYTGPTNRHQSEEEVAAAADAAVIDSPRSPYYEDQGVQLVQVAINETMTVTKRDPEPQVSMQSASLSLDELLFRTRGESFWQVEDVQSTRLSEVADQTSNEPNSDICISFQARAWNINEDLGQVEPLKTIEKEKL